MKHESENVKLKLSQAEVVVLGICRNVEDEIEPDVTRIMKAFEDFKRIHFRLIESDSKDRTLDVLNALSQQFPDFEYVTLGDLETKISSRVQRIAHCRNLCLKILNTDHNLKSANYVVVSDFDGVNPLLTRRGVRSCWEREDWDVCTANQSGAYYDIYALRHSIWSPDDCWKYEAQLLQSGMDPISAREKAVYARQIRIRPTSDWIEVDSAFGGLAIYRRETLKGVTYSAFNAQGEEICEHVTLHSQLRSRNFRIFINPKLVNLKWNGHNQSRKRSKALKRYLKLFLYKSAWRYWKSGKDLSIN